MALGQEWHQKQVAHCWQGEDVKVEKYCLLDEVFY